jgi:hypothetical protein
MLFNPQPWAEDAMYFLRDAMANDWGSFVMPYAGYLHTVPRIVAFLALHLSLLFGQGIAWVPALMNMSAIAISSLCAVAVCASKFDWLGNRYLRALLAFLILAFPGAGEVYGNVTNIHWWLGIITFLLSWNMFRAKSMPGWGATSVLTLITLSSPNGIMALPAMAGCYFYVNKSNITKDLYKVAMVALASMLQLYLIYTTRTGIAGPGDTAFFSSVSGWLSVGVFADLLVGNCAAFITTYGYGLLQAIGAALLLVMLLFGLPKFKELYVPFALLALILLVTIFGNTSYVSLFAGQYTSNGQRYIFIPAVMILYILVYEFNLYRQSKKYKMFYMTCFSVVFLLIAANLFSAYKINALLPDLQWKKRTTCYNAAGTTELFIPVHPLIVSYYAGFPSICGQASIEQFLDKFSAEKLTIDDSLIRFKRDVEITDSSYVINGSSPLIIFQLPKQGNLQYCCIDWAHPLQTATMQLFFLSEQGELLHHLTCAPTEKYLHQVIEIYPVIKNAHYIQLSFNGIKNSSIIIKQLSFYSVPAR